MSLAEDFGNVASELGWAMKNTVLSAAAAAFFVFAGSANALSVYSGADASGTTNSTNAFNSWVDSLSVYSVDDLSGLSGTTGAPGNLTSTAGNNFTSTDDSLFVSGSGSSVNLGLVKQGSAAQFTWNLSDPSDAFGFFAHGNNSGTIAITLLDGTSRTFNLGGKLNVFWGISGLESLIASVTIRTTDPAISHWDDFAVGTTAIPLPAAMPLLGTATGFLTLAGWRRRRKASASA